MKNVYYKPKKYLIVMLNYHDNELEYQSFDTYEEARKQVDAIDYKAVIVGPEGLEDHS